MGLFLFVVNQPCASELRRTGVVYFALCDFKKGAQWTPSSGVKNTGTKFRFV